MLPVLQPLTLSSSDSDAGSRDVRRSQKDNMSARTSHSALVSEAGASAAAVSVADQAPTAKEAAAPHTQTHRRKQSVCLQLMTAAYDDDPRSLSHVHVARRRRRCSSLAHTRGAATKSETLSHTYSHKRSKRDKSSSSDVRGNHAVSRTSAGAEEQSGIHSRKRKRVRERDAHERQHRQKP